jgi:hypothetical protein
VAHAVARVPGGEMSTEGSVCTDKNGSPIKGSRSKWQVVFLSMKGEQKTSYFNVVCCPCCRGPKNSDLESRDCRIITHGGQYGTHHNGERTWIPPLR